MSNTRNLPARSLRSIAPIVLAAGDSSRMGYPKALLPLGPDLFLTRILATISKVGLPKPIVVLGRAASMIRDKTQGWDADFLINPEPGRGQLSSIQIALSHLSPNMDAGLLWPVDMPAVSGDLVRSLVGLFLDSGASIAFPIYGERRGHPAIFHRSLFQEFMEAPLEEGPKKILVRHQQSTSTLPVAEPGIFKDIDTPADYRALTGEELESALARRKSRPL
jgi:molybdenum cofactor cytidylyltransferase